MGGSGREIIKHMHPRHKILITLSASFREINKIRLLHWIYLLRFLQIDCLESVRYHNHLQMKTFQTPNHWNSFHLWLVMTFLKYITYLLGRYSSMGIERRPNMRVQILYETTNVLLSSAVLDYLIWINIRNKVGTNMKQLYCILITNICQVDKHCIRWCFWIRRVFLITLNLNLSSD